MAKNYNDDDGVWRTIGGRRVFIRNGQDLAEAMKESGKFKSAKKTSKETNEEKEINKDTELKEKLDQLRKDRKGLVYNLEEGYMKDLSTEEKLEKLNKEIDTIKGDKERIDKIDKEAMEYQKQKRGEKGVEEYKKYMEQGDDTFKKAKEDRMSGVKEQDERMKKSYDDAKKMGMSNEDATRTSLQAEKNYQDNKKLMGYEIRDGKKRLVERELRDSDPGYWTKENGQRVFKENPNYKEGTFEVSELKKKALETLPKKDIDTHEGDLYIKKTKESTALLNQMKNHDSGLLTTFRDEKTGETWYDVPFANMGDDFKEKTGGNSNVKVKGDSNVIPRDFEKGYGKFKVETNSNKGNLDDRYEITKDENGFHAKNLRTGETYATFGEHLRNNNVFEFENSNKSNNEKMNNAIRSKAFKEDLPKKVEIKEQGTSNRKEVSENIQAHILDYYGEDFTGENIPATEAFVSQMDYMRAPTMWKAGEEIASGGSYLIYTEDMRKFLDDLKINPKGKEFSDDRVFQTYTSLVGRESERLYKRIKRNAYNKYKKEHPLTQMSFEEFVEQSKK